MTIDNKQATKVHVADLASQAIVYLGVPSTPEQRRILKNLQQIIEICKGR